MKNKDKKRNQIFQDENLDFVEIPLDNLPQYIEMIKSTDIDATNIQLTSKGKWAYMLMSDTQRKELTGISATDEDEEKDPRLDILPSHIHAVPIYMICFYLVAQIHDLLEINDNLMSIVNALSEDGGNEE